MLHKNNVLCQSQSTHWTASLHMYDIQYSMPWFPKSSVAGVLEAMTRKNAWDNFKIDVLSVQCPLCAQLVLLCKLCCWRIVSPQPCMQIRVQNCVAAVYLALFCSFYAFPQASWLLGHVLALLQSQSAFPGCDHIPWIWPTANLYRWSTVRMWLP